MNREEFDLLLKDALNTLRVNCKFPFEEWEGRSRFDLIAELLKKANHDDEGWEIREYIFNFQQSFRKDYPQYTFQFNVHEKGITISFRNKKTGKPGHFLIEKNIRGTWKKFWKEKASDGLVLIWRAFEQFN